MFLQDHRENGQLQPDHPRDCPSLGAAGGNNSLYDQPSEPLQLHQYRRHPACEERPAAANPATRCAWSADHYDPLHKLVCLSYTVLQTLLAHMSIGQLSLHNQIKLSMQSLFIYFCCLLFYLYQAFRVYFFSVNHTALTLCLAFFSLGFWRACCVRPAMPSSSNVLLCTALSTRAQTASQVLEQRSFQMWQVRPRVPYGSLLLPGSRSTFKSINGINLEPVNKFWPYLKEGVIHTW